MKVKWLSVASFLLIMSDEGIKIIIDPYQSGGAIKSAELFRARQIFVTDQSRMASGRSRHNYMPLSDGNVP